MAYKTAVRPDQRLGIVKADRLLSEEEAVQALDALTAQPAWQAGFNIMLDARGIPVPLLGVREIAACEQWAAGRAGRIGRTALIVGSTGGPMNRVVAETEADVDGRPFQVFHSPDDAANWLGVAEAVLDGPQPFGPKQSATSPE